MEARFRIGPAQPTHGYIYICVCDSSVLSKVVI